MGDTGLTESVDYLAVPLTSLSSVTTGNTEDVRAVMYGIAQALLRGMERIDEPEQYQREPVRDDTPRVKHKRNRRAQTRTRSEHTPRDCEDR
jgi:hypothetical protein